MAEEKKGSGWDWSKLISDTLNAYTQIEVAKAGGGVATAPYQQQAGLGAVPTYQNPQGTGSEIGAMPGQAPAPTSPWVWPLLIGGGLLAAVFLTRGN